MLEAKDQKSRTQGLDTIVSKKKGLLKFTARSLAHSTRRRKKKGHDLGPFVTNQKIVLSTANRAFWRLVGQGQGLQDVFSRTSKRTPPLKNTNAIRDKINAFFA